MKKHKQTYPGISNDSLNDGLYHQMIQHIDNKIYLDIDSVLWYDLFDLLGEGIKYELLMDLNSKMY